MGAGQVTLSSIRSSRQASGVSLAAGDRFERPGSSPGWNSVALSSQDFLPATNLGAALGLSSTWHGALIRRTKELAVRPEGWDSYGACALDPTAVQALLEVLVDADPFIQSAPSVSLTTDGGLLCEWESSEATLDLSTSKSGRVEVYFRDLLTNEEYDGDITQFRFVDKWLWRASATL